MPKANKKSKKTESSSSANIGYEAQLWQITHGDAFRNDRHLDLKADYVLAKPPCNDSDWRGELLNDDTRWVYSTPCPGNVSFAWRAAA